MLMNFVLRLNLSGLTGQSENNNHNIFKKNACLCFGPDIKILKRYREVGKLARDKKIRYGSRQYVFKRSISELMAAGWWKRGLQGKLGSSEMQHSRAQASYMSVLATWMPAVIFLWSFFGFRQWLKLTCIKRRHGRMLMRIARHPYSVSRGLLGKDVNLMSKTCHDAMTGMG